MEFGEFEWDENKRLKNLEKHRIDFEDVPEFFSRPFLSQRSDRDGEERCIAIGLLKDQYITIVYTFRRDCCRIISARKARENEREAYNQAFEK